MRSATAFLHAGRRGPSARSRPGFPLATVAGSIGLLIVGVGNAQGQRLLSLGPGPETPAVAAAAQFDSAMGPATVQVDLDLVRSAPPRLELPTPDGRVLVAQRSVFEDRGNGSVMWAGSLLEAGHESVVLTVEDGSFVGRFGEPGGARFRISADPDGRGGMVDTAGAPTDTEETFCPVGVEPDGLLRFSPAEAPMRVDQEQRVVQPQNHDELDILVLYTAEAARNWANRGGALASVRNAGDYLNLVLRNGQLPIQANIVHVARAPAALDTVAREGVGPYGSSLITQLRWNGDVAQLRGQHDADLVHLFTGESTRLLQACGRANLLTQASTAEDFAPLAYGWSANACFTYDDAQIFAHEIGHNLGANHDPANAAGTAAVAVEPFAFGHSNHDHIPNVGTAMSYRGEVEPYFSSARIRPRRRTIGIAGERENERVLRRTMRLGVEYSDALLKPPEGAPAAPSNVRVEVTGATSARVSWVDNSDDEEGFRVWVQALGDPLAFGRLVDADQESFEVEDLEPGFNFFWVTSHIGNSRSRRTSFVDAVVPGAEPAAPTDLRVTPILNIAALTWTDNSDDEAGFEVQVLREGELWYRREALADREFGIVIGLEPGVRYVFRVSSVSGGGLSWSEDAVVEWPEQEGPAAPTNLRATVTDTTSIRLDWRDNSDDEVKFEVRASVSGWSELLTVDPDTESVEIRGLARGGRYRFTVTAEDAEGGFGTSNSLVVPLGVGGRGPNGPRRLRSTPVDATSARLTWDDDATDEIGFEIQVRLAGDSWRRVALIGANEEAYLLKGLAPDSTDDYRVFAYNDSGFSGSSNVVTVKLRGGGSRPTEFTASPSGDSAVDLKWSGRWADGSLGLITVEGRNPESNWVELVTAQASAGSVQVTGLMTDTPYTFRLASGSGGAREFSQEVSATTGAFRDACRIGGQYLCLRDGRFEVQAHWSNPDMAGEHGFGTGVPIDFSDESGLFWFFEPDNVELVLKVLDGTALNGNFWVFFGALSDVEYWVTVEDTQSRQRRTYHNPPKEICGQSDIAAFSGAGQAATLALPGRVRGEPGIDLLKMEVARLPATGLERSEESAGQCEAGKELLCLLDDRFSVEVGFVDPNLEPPDNEKTATVAPSLTTANTGFFWFFNKENIELAVKVLDGQAINGSFWVLYGGLSDVQYEMTVEDTVTGAIASYENERGSLCGRVDLEPFESF